MKKMVFVLLVILSVLLLSIASVSAHEHNFAETKKLINLGISCDNLADEQLEAIGDYYMEQMHSGEAHEIMDKMMGGEGSESLKQVHINMAKRIYCNEDISGMMGGGMMDMMGSNMMGYGMMGNYGFGFGNWNFINILYIILLIGLIGLVYLWIFKLWNSMQNKSRKK